MAILPITKHPTFSTQYKVLTIASPLLSANVIYIEGTQGQHKCLRVSLILFVCLLCSRWWLSCGTPASPSLRPQDHQQRAQRLHQRQLHWRESPPEPPVCMLCVCIYMCMYVLYKTLIVEGLLSLTRSAVFPVSHIFRGFQDQESLSPHKVHMYLYFDLLIAPLVFS